LSFQPQSRGRQQGDIQADDASRFLADEKPDGREIYDEKPDFVRRGDQDENPASIRMRTPMGVDRREGVARP
jgi:hypothetical protein